jgi:hypothetical protein
MNNSIARFVYDRSNPVIESFDSQFMNLEIENIIQLTFDTYGNDASYMHMVTQKKCWNEVLKLILYQYIKSLLTTAHKKVKKLDDLIEKLKKDKEIMHSAFQRLLGPNLTTETLKIIDDFLDFLDVSSYMISISCAKLREFNGPSFTLATAKALINLRIDLSKTEKKEAIDSCKEVIDKYVDTNMNGNRNRGFFDNLNKDIINQEKKDEMMTLDEDLEDIDTGITNRRKTLNLTDFLNLGCSPLETNEDLIKEDNIKEAHFVKKSSHNVAVDSDVVFAGYMEKKSYNTYI